MKLIYILPILILLLMSWNVSACANPTDSFASEVLLNKTGISYNLTELKGSKNVTSQEGAVIYRSHYNPDVAVILREISEGDQKGFSVRLQVPTDLVNVDINVFNFSEALRTELIWLMDNKVVSGLTDADINEIGKKARRGTAGYNSRIVYFKEDWLSYRMTDMPLFKVGSDCGGFPLNALPTGTVANLESGDSGELKSTPHEYKRTDSKPDRISGETEETPQMPGFEMAVGILGILAVCRIIGRRNEK